MKPMPPCGKECPERDAGCHARCEKYAAYRAELDARKPANYANGDYIAYVKGVISRNARHKAPKNRRNFKREDKH